MLQAHMTCLKELSNFSREIRKQDKTVQFDKNYIALFKKNCEDVFGYNLFLEENLPKNASNNQIKKAKKRLYKKCAEESKLYLRTQLFENPCILKCEKCKYLDTDYLVTIYYDQLTDLFAIV